MKTTTDYMGTPVEIAKQPHAEMIFREIAAWRSDPKEKAQVLRALRSFWAFAHAFDDLVDGDFHGRTPTNTDEQRRKKELAWRALAEFVSNLLTNPFLFTNAESVDAILISAIGRQLDGDLLEQRGESADLQRAVRCADLDVILHLARLAGGWECMRAVAPMVRYYDEGERPTSNAQRPTSNENTRLVALRDWFDREDAITERKAVNV